MKSNRKVLPLCLGAIYSIVSLPSATASDFSEWLAENNVKADFRLRYESVDQDNALQNADALTLRSRIGYQMGSLMGFSGFIEVENVQSVFSVDDYSVPPSNFNPGVYSVIADPKGTEVDQAYLQYRTKDLQFRLGRQVITTDNQRFIGHVGFRQDRQTFDGAGVKYSPYKGLNMQYHFINKRNRIFSNDADIDSRDHILNITTKTALGNFTGYGYFLEVDNSTHNSLDTVGMRLTGKRKLSEAKLDYTLEYASQVNETGNTQFNTHYWLFEAGLGYTNMKFTLGYEVLGSDGGNYGFATPLATLHKFNGWSDSFLATPAVGLKDAYVKLTGKAAGGNYFIGYHKFNAEESGINNSDFGHEWNLQFTRKISDNYLVGVKYARYEAGDIKVDTDKWWLWLDAKF